MSKNENYTYKSLIDLKDKFSQPTIIINLIKRNSIVLDVGCGNGFLGKYLKEKCGCKVFGIEKNEVWANEAQKYYDNVVIGDLNDEKIWEKTEDKFDAVILADILEHLINPEAVLGQIKKIIRRDSEIIISLPNIALWRIRLNLLIGKFNYTKRGILDETHLHFFTLKSAKEMIIKSGYQIQEIFIAQPQIPFEGKLRLSQIPFVKDLLTEIKRVVSKFFPALFGTQFIFHCKIIDQL